MEHANEIYVENRSSKAGTWLKLPCYGDLTASLAGVLTAEGGLAELEVFDRQHLVCPLYDIASYVKNIDVESLNTLAALGVALDAVDGLIEPSLSWYVEANYLDGQDGPSPLAAANIALQAAELGVHWFDEGTTWDICDGDLDATYAAGNDMVAVAGGIYQLGLKDLTECFDYREFGYDEARQRGLDEIVHDYLRSNGSETESYGRERANDVGGLACLSRDELEHYFSYSEYALLRERRGEIEISDEGWRETSAHVDTGRYGWSEIQRLVGTEERHIDKNSFYKLTKGHFEPCAEPAREPDRQTGSSSYWFSPEGVVRRSDHWGWGIASCTWTLGDEKPAHCGRGKKLGQRTGFIPWSDLETPEVKIHLTHQFGELDYAAIGALPIERGEDEFGPYDVFRVRPDMVSEKGGVIDFAGNEYTYSNGREQINLSAAGDAYIDPEAQEISLAWKDERAAARAEGRRANLDDWLPSQRRKMGLEAEPDWAGAVGH